MASFIRSAAEFAGTNRAAVSIDASQMKRLRPTRFAGFIVLAILASVVVVDMSLQARRVGPMSLFLGVLAIGWFLGWALGFNRPKIWPVTLVVGLWTLPFVWPSYQELVAITLPAAALLWQAAPRWREGRVLGTLLSAGLTGAVWYYGSDYYLSAELLFLAGVWCLLIGYGFLDTRSDTRQTIPPALRDTSTLR